MKPSRSTSFLAALAVAVLLSTVTAPQLRASDPSEGTIGPPAGTEVEWTGPFEATAFKRDLFALTIVSPGEVSVTISWDSPTNNYALTVVKGTGESSDPIVAESDNSAVTSQDVTFDADAARYTVRVVYITPLTPNGATPDNPDGDGTAYRGVATFLGEPPQEPRSEVIFDDSNSVAFGPATIVSGHFLGSEPQIAMERPLPGSDDIDADRLFVDWPLTTRQQIGQLSRSTDGGDSFRLLFDPKCAERSRPTCQTGGGGDTDTAVNAFDGTVYFADQQGFTASEAVASSTDHGDSFPPARQRTVTNPTFLVDRQWLAPAPLGGRAIEVDGKKIGAFLTMRQLAVGLIVQGIDQDGVPVLQTEPQLPGAHQSGPLRVDSSCVSGPEGDNSAEGCATPGKGHGWLYQPYDDGTFKVATVDGDDYQTPSKWELNKVSNDDPVLFPWIDLDGEGNAYAAWVAQDGEDFSVFYSYSSINDPRNDPTNGGRPGTFWAPKARVSLPELGSAVFPAIVAGDPGRIAISYMGTEDWRGLPDDAPALFTPARWHSYTAIVTDALGENGLPVVSTGRVSHRLAHQGNICTGGAGGCIGADQSLLDLMDIGADADGRAGVAFMDNHSSFARPEDQAVSGFPFVHFAKQIAGPSLDNDDPQVHVSLPAGPRKDPSGDATWPNLNDHTRSTALPTLDALEASLVLEDDELVARLPLTKASANLMGEDLIAYNRVPTSNPPAARLQYVVRFSTADDVYHLSMEHRLDGTRTFFGGKLGPNDALDNGSDVFGAGYHTDFQARGTVQGDTIVIRADAADVGIREGSDLFSVTAFTMAGPLEAKEKTIFNTMRTIDATPPFDTTLAFAPVPEPSPSSSATPTPSPTASPTPTPSPSPEPTPSATPPREVPPARGRCDIVGTAGNDLLEGTSGDDVICGRGGSDVILGRGGNDVIRGGRGRDRIFGGDGHDLLRGKLGRDDITGGAGNDVLHGGKGKDFLDGRRGRDVCHGSKRDHTNRCRTP